MSDRPCWCDDGLCVGALPDPCPTREFWIDVDDSELPEENQ